MWFWSSYKVLYELEAEILGFCIATIYTMIEMKMLRGKASHKARKWSKTKPCSSNNYWVVKQGDTLF